MQDLSGKDRLIVALDVPTSAEALALVKKLDNVSFFKVGWELFCEEGFLFIEKLEGRQVFVDLKIPGDIGNTVSRVTDQFIRRAVKFMTLSESMPLAAIRAVRAARGSRSEPALLTVPLLSSLNEDDLKDIAPAENLEMHILRHARLAIDAGCDGLIASGDAIHMCKHAFPDKIIVSPGIRPAGTVDDPDHKRHTTPSKAIELGADFLVVGRPIRNAPDPHDAARRIIEEIDQALKTRKGSSGLTQSSDTSVSWAAQSPTC